MTKLELISLIREMGYDFKHYIVNSDITYTENSLTLNRFKIYFLFITIKGIPHISIRDDKAEEYEEYDNTISVSEFISLLRVRCRVEKINILKRLI